MRDYLIPILMTVCLGSMATVQVVKNPHWSGGYAIAVVLASCAGFNWWWTYHTRSPRPPMESVYAAGAVALSAALAILAAFSL
jgi:hypothetical protein